MKLILIVFAFLFTGFCAFAQTADEIINKQIEAVGGADNWMKVNSIKQQGSLTVQGAKVDLVLTVLKGKGTRQDITLESSGMSGYQIVTPTEGWNYMPFNGMQAPEAMTADELVKSQDDLDPEGPLVGYKEKGYTVEYLGEDDVEGTGCFKLKINLKGGKTQTMFIDTSNYYIIKVITKQTVNGQEMEVPTTFSNYEKLPEGIIVPKSIVLPFGELVISKTEVNGAVDENIFKKPK